MPFSIRKIETGPKRWLHARRCVADPPKGTRARKPAPVACPYAGLALWPLNDSQPYLMTFTTESILHRAHFETPLGWVTAVASEAGLRSVLVYDAAPAVPLAGDHPHLAACERQMAEYFRGERQKFEVPLDAVGTPWQRQIWAALCEIPYGETVSYGEIARRLNAPGAARAVGTANARNPIWIIVPCHRVIGASGALTGYAGGMTRKGRLLELERMNVSGSLFAES